MITTTTLKNKSEWRRRCLLARARPGQTAGANFCVLFLKMLTPTCEVPAVTKPSGDEGIVFSPAWPTYVLLYPLSPTLKKKNLKSIRALLLQSSVERLLFLWLFCVGGGGRGGIRWRSPTSCSLSNIFLYVVAHTHTEETKQKNGEVLKRVGGQVRTPDSFRHLEVWVLMEVVGGWWLWFVADREARERTFVSETTKRRKESCSTT